LALLLVGTRAQQLPPAIARLLGPNANVRTIDSSQLGSLGLGGLTSQLGNLGSGGQIILLLGGGQGGLTSGSLNTNRVTTTTTTNTAALRPAVSVRPAVTNTISTSTNRFDSRNTVSSSDDSGDLGGPPTPYSFAYDTDDEAGTTTRREESGDASGIVRGSYSYRDADGVFRTVEYTADETGFHATVKTNEPGTGRNEEIGDPADTVFEVEPPPQAVVDRYLNAASFVPAPTTVRAPAPAPVARTSAASTDSSSSVRLSSSTTTTGGVGGQAFALVPVNAAGGFGGLSGLTSGGSLGGLGGNIIVLRGVNK